MPDADLIDPTLDRVSAVDVTVSYTTYVVAEAAEEAKRIAEDAADDPSPTSPPASSPSCWSSGTPTHGSSPTAGRAGRAARSPSTRRWSWSSATSRSTTRRPCSCPSSTARRPSTRRTSRTTWRPRGGHDDQPRPAPRSRHRHRRQRPRPAEPGRRGCLPHPQWLDPGAPVCGRRHLDSLARRQRGQSLPSQRPTVADFALRMGTLLAALAVAEDRSQLAVLVDLDTASADHSVGAQPDSRTAGRTDWMEPEYGLRRPELTLVLDLAACRIERRTFVRELQRLDWPRGQVDELADLVCQLLAAGPARATEESKRVRRDDAEEASK